MQKINSENSQRRVVDRLRSGLACLCVSMLIFPAGCVKKERQVSAPTDSKAENPYRAAEAQDLSDYIRAVFKISQQGSSASETAVAQLQEARPELAELAHQIEQDPANLDARMALASAYLEEGLYSKALILYEELRALGVEQPETEMALARIWYSWRNYVTALQHVEQTLELDPEFVPALELLGRIHLHREQYSSAIAAFLKALETAGEDDASLFHQIGLAHLKAGNWLESRDYLQQALQLDESLTQVHEGLGVVLAHLGDSEKALKHFLVMGDPAQAYNRLGDVYLERHDWVAARMAFREALRLEPQYTAAALNLAEAESYLPPPAQIHLEPFSGSSVVRLAQKAPDIKSPDQIALSQWVGQSAQGILDLPAFAARSGATWVQSLRWQVSGRTEAEQEGQLEQTSLPPVSLSGDVAQLLAQFSSEAVREALRGQGQLPNNRSPEAAEPHQPASQKESEGDSQPVTQLEGVPGPGLVSAEEKATGVSSLPESIEGPPAPVDPAERDALAGLPQVWLDREPEAWRKIRILDDGGLVSFAETLPTLEPVVRNVPESWLPKETLASPAAPMLTSSKRWLDDSLPLSGRFKERYSVLLSQASPNRIVSPGLASVELPERTESALEKSTAALKKDLDSVKVGNGSTIFPGPVIWPAAVHSYGSMARSSMTFPPVPGWFQEFSVFEGQARLLNSHTDQSDSASTRESSVQRIAQAKLNAKTGLISAGPLGILLGSILGSLLGLLSAYLAP